MTTTQLQKRAAGARFDLSPPSFGISDTSKKNAISFLLARLRERRAARVAPGGTSQTQMKGSTGGTVRNIWWRGGFLSLIRFVPTAVYALRTCRASGGLAVMDQEFARQTGFFGWTT